MIMNLTGVKKDDLGVLELKMKQLMKRAPNVRMHQRYQTIYLLAKDYPVAAIADIVGVTAERHLHLCFPVQGSISVDALAMNKYHGAPSKLTLKQEETLKTVIKEKKPVDVGFPVEMN